MRSIRILAALALVAGLSACVEQMPPLNFSAPNVGVSSVKIPAELKTVNVAMAAPHEKTGEIDFIIAESAGTSLGSGSATTQTWKMALDDAILRMAIFQDDASRKVSLSVKILKLDVPAMGASFTTEAAARYEIIDRRDGSIVYVQDINSTGTCPADFAFLGAARARESVNRAVQNNVTLFLQALETVDLTKPMFPSTPASVIGPES